MLAELIRSKSIVMLSPSFGEAGEAERVMACKSNWPGGGLGLGAADGVGLAEGEGATDGVAVGAAAVGVGLGEGAAVGEAEAAGDGLGLAASGLADGVSAAGPQLQPTASMPSGQMHMGLPHTFEPAMSLIETTRPNEFLQRCISSPEGSA
jgi:hypothetical protein